MIDTKALRQKILDMAIRGKLVPQNPNDEPASVLLERIRAEKQQLIKEGKIKKDKNDSVIFKGDDNRYYEKVGSEVKDITDELPFEIPDNWVWTRFSTLIRIISGVSYDKNDVATKGIRILRGGNINDLRVTPFSDDVYLPETYYDPDKQVQIDDVLIVASTGSKEVIGKAGYVIEPLENTQIGAFLRIVRPLLKWYAPYVKLIFATEYYREHIRHLSGGTNINNIKADYINAFLISLPPYAEQIRIAERINSLFEQIDIIEQNQADIDTLYDEFRKRTLTLAIQGKLVPQDSNDEPASVLLERIRAEKKAKLGKKYVDSYIYKSDDNCYYEHIAGRAQDEQVEVPFDIPDNWAWVRWGNLSFSIQYGYNAPAKESGRIKMVRISDIHNNEVDWEHVPFCDINETDIKTYLLKENDILFARTGGTVGKSYLVTCVPEEAIYAGYLIRTQYSAQLSAQYLKFFMESSLYWMQLKDGTIATAQPNCNGQTLSKMILPLPPLAEQKRIVAKINEMFAIL